MGGILMLVFIYLAGVVIGAIIVNPEVDYYAERKRSKYFKGLHIFMLFLFLFFVASGMFAGY